MSALRPPPLPPLAVDVSSCVLATVALMFFFLPILGIPVAGVALALGAAGLVIALFQGPASLRWSLVGIALAAIALTVNVGMWYGPQGYIDQRPAMPSWQPLPDRPAVPPPESS